MKIWTISDTHNKHNLLQVPKVDMIIFAGDESNHINKFINKREYEIFIKWFRNLPIKYKVMIAGNHSIHLFNKQIKSIEGIYYLCNSSCEIEGIKIYGSPNSLKHGKYFAFQKKDLFKIWNKIPLDTDILITHTPPKGILDLADGKYILEYTGCKNLLNKVKEIQPKYHIFGHIHEDGGKTQTIWNCKTTFVNAAVVTPRLKFNNNGHILNI